MIILTDDRKLKDNRQFKLKSYIQTKVRYFFFILIQSIIIKYKYYKLKLIVI